MIFKFIEILILSKCKILILINLKLKIKILKNKYQKLSLILILFSDNYYAWSIEPLNFIWVSAKANNLLIYYAS